MARRRPAFSRPDYEAASDDNESEAYGGYIPQVVIPAQPNLTLTDDVATQLIDLVKQGMMVHDAANLLMIHPRTLRSWITAGDADPTSAYGWFAFRIRQAQAQFVQEMVKNVRTNAKYDGNVALKTLEKAASGDWKPAANLHEVTGKVVHEHVGTELARIVEERKAKKLAASTSPEMPQDAPQAPVQGEYREDVE